MIEKVKIILTSHYKFACFVSTSVFLTGCVAASYSELKFLVAVYFMFSLITIIRLLTYKFGKAPIIMNDKTWEKYRLKHPDDELEKIYKEMSLRRAAYYFFFSLLTFLVWILVEIIKP